MTSAARIDAQARGPAEIRTAPVTDEELTAVVARIGAESERRGRGAMANLLVTLGAVIVASSARLPIARHVWGDTSSMTVLAVSAAVWTSYELAALAFHVFGPDHAVTTVASTLDALVRQSAFIGLVWCSGSAASVVWVAAMADAFEWRPKSTRRRAVALAVLVTPFVVLATAFALAGKTGDAWLTVLVLLASTIGHLMSARMAASNAQVRAERDAIELRLREALLRQDRERLARELHDGIGADIMALVFRLRREARATSSAQTARLAERAQGLLDELRGVVWSLRNEQGTLAELGKLIDATCRSVGRDVRYARTTPLASSQTPIGPRAARTALTTAREYAKAAASRPNIAHCRVELTVTDALELRVEDDGGGRVEMRIALDGAHP